MKVKYKLLLGFSIVLGLMLTIGLVSLDSINTLTANIFLQEEETVQTHQLERAKEAIWELRLGAALYPGAAPERRVTIFGEQKKWYQAIDMELAAFAKGTCSTEDYQVLSELQQTYSKFIQTRSHWFELVQAGKLEEAARWKAENNGRYASALVKELDHMLVLHEEANAAAQRQVIATVATSKSVLFVILVIGLLIGFGVTFILSRRISRATRELEIASRGLAVGDTNLEISVRGNDEFGAMAESFRQMVAYFKEAANVSMAMSMGDLSQDIAPKSEHDQFGFAISLMIVNLRDIIGRVTASAGFLSEAADKSNDTTRKTSESIEEIFYSIQQISNNVDRVNESSLTATELAKNGREEVAHTIRGMEEINSVMIEIMALMERLTVSSSQIGNIVALIDGIAKQTNLLALNATIEAARAGEQGRGFAVVADEVRQLAKHSTEEAAQISKLIQGIQEEMNGVSNVTKKGDRTIKEGILRANSAGEALVAIVTAVDRVKLLVEDINQSIGEQNRSSRHIVTVIEEVVVGADNLRDKARGILDAVSYFKGVDGVAFAAEGFTNNADDASGVTMW